MGKNLAPIIFVWVGKHIPNWFFESLSLASQNNINREIILIVNCNHKSIDTILGPVKNIKISLVNINAPVDLDSKKLINDNFFWVNTSLRFWYLRDYVRKYKVKEFFHAELDNAIFSLKNLDEKLNSVGKGIFVPRDSLERGVASLIYCNRVKCLDEFIHIYRSISRPKHDMEALGIYAAKSPNNFFSLPTESFQSNSEKWKLINPLITDGIFDAASIGQYLLGIDPNNLQCKPSWNGFINENCKIDWSEVKVNSDGAGISLKFGFNSYNFCLYNLHIHSKNWKAFRGILENGTILKELNQGTVTIVSGKRYLIFGYFCSFFWFIIKNLKKVLRKFKGK